VNHGLASPDGIVTVNGEKHLVEIKCPCAARDMTVEEAVSTVKSFCLSKEGDELTLRHTHKYYYWVQVQLHVCKLSKCYFVVWTQKTSQRRLVLTMIFLQAIIAKLRSYYFQELLPALCIDSR